MCAHLADVRVLMSAALKSLTPRISASIAAPMGEPRAKSTHCCTKLAEASCTDEEDVLILHTEEGQLARDGFSKLPHESHPRL